MYKRPKAKAQPKKDEHNRKRNIIVNFCMFLEEWAELEQRMLMDIQHRIVEIETELKRVVSADAVDMEKLAGLKSLIELFRAVEE